MRAHPTSTRTSHGRRTSPYRVTQSVQFLGNEGKHARDVFREGVDCFGDVGYFGFQVLDVLFYLFVNVTCKGG